MRFKFRLHFLLALSMFAMATISAHAEVSEELPFRYYHNLLWIKVSVAGRAEPLDFLFDTGAGSTVLDIETAEALGLKSGNTEVVRRVDSRGTAKWMKGFDAQVAGLPMPSALLAIDLSAASRTCHQKIDGLLGADFLKNRIFQIDYAAGKIRWLDHSDPTIAGVSVLPIKKRNDGLCISATIAGNKERSLRLDTGCDESLRWVARKSDNLKDLHLEAGLVISGTSIQHVKTGVQLGATYFGDVNVGIQGKAMFPDEDGLLGNGLLSHFTVTIDTVRRLLILKPN